MPSQSSVTPIMATNIAWTNFLKDVVTLTGLSPTREIDRVTIPLSDYKKWLMALEEFSGYPGLDHLFLGFLISGSKRTISDIILRTDLHYSVSKNREVMIISGSLRAWRQAIIDILTCERNPNLIEIFNQIYLFLRQLGLESIFSDYHRKEKDGLFLLEYNG